MRLSSAQTQDVHTAIAPVKIAGDYIPDHEQAALVLCCREVEEFCQVPDQVACMMVRCAHDVVHPLTVHIEIDNDVLLPIQIKLLKEYDGNTPPAVSSILLRQMIHAITFFFESIVEQMIRKVNTNA